MPTESPVTPPLTSVTNDVSPGPNGVTFAESANMRPKKGWRLMLWRPKRSESPHQEPVPNASSPATWRVAGGLRTLAVSRTSSTLQRPSSAWLRSIRLVCWPSAAWDAIPRAPISSARRTARQRRVENEGDFGLCGCSILSLILPIVTLAYIGAFTTHGLSAPRRPEDGLRHRRSQRVQDTSQRPRVAGVSRETSLRPPVSASDFRPFRRNAFARAPAPCALLRPCLSARRSSEATG